jgi:hypothetical protein
MPEPLLGNALRKQNTFPRKQFEQRLHSNESTHNKRSAVGYGIFYGGSCRGVLRGTKVKLASFIPCGGGVE